MNGGFRDNPQKEISEEIQEDSASFACGSHHPDKKSKKAA